MPADSLRNSLVACSLCLRVRDGGTWVDAGEMIRRLRTYERDDVMRLGDAICEHCEAGLRRRRRRDSERLAA